MRHRCDRKILASLWPYEWNLYFGAAPFGDITARLVAQLAYNFACIIITCLCTRIMLLLEARRCARPCTLGWKKGKLYVNRRVSPMTMIRWKRVFILLFLFDLILSWIHNSLLKAILRNLLRKSKITSLFYRDATLKYIIINPSAENSTIFINIEKLYVETPGYLV